ncbi:MAG: aryl-sulfate sulfotransferase [Saprospiraceae bacterium]|nr:aryl-sulfate sulfotransferase [Saprospiraceae bacterium]
MQDKLSKSIFKILIIFTVFSLSPIIGQKTVGLIKNDASAADGYTLFSPLSAKKTYLIDNCGRVIKSWESDFFPGQVSYLLENGDLLRTARIGGFFTGGGVGGRVEIFDWEGDLKWSYNFAGNNFHQHHVVYPMPNGNILILLWDSYSKEESINAGFNQALVTEQGIWSEKIWEVKPLGTDDFELVWEWKLWDHLIQDIDSTKSNFGIVENHPGKMNVNFRSDPGPNPADWMHFNAIDYHPISDQIVLSSKHMNELYIIDHGTSTTEAASSTGGKYGKGGDFLYRWGNPLSYNNGNSSDRLLFGQHDVQWISKDGIQNDNLIFYNNGSNRPAGFYSSVDEIEVPQKPDFSYHMEENGKFGPNQYFWSFTASPKESFFSPRVSGVQRLWNGNTLVCEGNNGRFFELTPEKEIVWEYVNPVNGFGIIPQGSDPVSNDVFKISRYPVDFAGFFEKTLIPGDMLESNSIPFECQTSHTQDEITPAIYVHQNPVHDQIRVINPEMQSLNLYLMDVTGKQVLNKTAYNQTIELNVSDFPQGSYFLKISDIRSGIIFKFVILKI